MTPLPASGGSLLGTQNIRSHASFLYDTATQLPVRQHAAAEQKLITKSSVKICSSAAVTVKKCICSCCLHYTAHHISCDLTCAASRGWGWQHGSSRGRDASSPALQHAPFVLHDMAIAAAEAAAAAYLAEASQGSTGALTECLSTTSRSRHACYVHSQHKMPTC